MGGWFFLSQDEEYNIVCTEQTIKSTDFTNIDGVCEAVVRLQRVECTFLELFLTLFWRLIL